MVRTIHALLFDDSAATMVEYGIMVALIAAVCIVLVASMGRKVSNAFSTVNSAL